MPNDLGLNYARPRKVIGLFEESIKTAHEYDKRSVKIISRTVKNVLGMNKRKAGLQRMY